MGVDVGRPAGTSFHSPACTARVANPGADTGSFFAFFVPLNELAPDDLLTANTLSNRRKPKPTTETQRHRGWKSKSIQCNRQRALVVQRRNQIRVHPCQSVASSSYFTSAIANPSYPFTPTVCSAVALTRGSAANFSLNRRMPCTRTSALDASITAPSRTTLSATITVPGRESFSDQS